MEKWKTLFDFSVMCKIPLMLVYDKNDFGSISENDEFRIKENLKITYDAFSWKSRVFIEKWKTLFYF